jgi:hypothetical protein
MMNLKVSGGKWLWSILTFTFMDRGKPRNMSVTKPGDLAEIRIEHLPNTRLERIGYTDLLIMYIYIKMYCDMTPESRNSGAVGDF